MQSVKKCLELGRLQGWLRDASLRSHRLSRSGEFIEAVESLLPDRSVFKAIMA